MYTWTIAWRYMRRRLISLVAVLLVTCVVIMYLVVISVQEGFKNHYMDKIQSIMAHITVDVGNLSWGIKKPEEWKAEVAAVDPDIRGITIEQETPAMALFGDWRTMGPLHGIDLDQELKYGRLKEILTPDSVKELTEFGTHKVDGRNLRGCIVGGAWRKSYGLKLGDRVSFLFTSDTDDTRFPTFTIIGFFEGNNPYLETSAYVDRKALSEAIGQPEHAKSLHIWLKDPNSPRLQVIREKVRAKMQEILTREAPTIAGRLEVETWQQKDNHFYEAVTRENAMLRVIMTFFLALVAFIIFLIFGRLVAEKVRDIGALRALGASPSGILRCFLLQGIVIGAIGLLLGLGAAEIFLRNMNGLTGLMGVNPFAQSQLAAGQIPFVTLTYDRAMISAFTILAAILGAFLPAFRASRMNPVECLRHE